VAPKRRTIATTGVALLVAGGAAGTYLAVAGSLVGMNADAHDPAGPAQAAPEKPVSVSNPQKTPQRVPDKRSHRRAAPVPIAPVDIPPIAQPTPTPTKTVEATPTPTASPTDTPTPSPSVSASTTDDESPQFTGRHRWRHPGQSPDGR
jgi:hypothetical protein